LTKFNLNDHIPAIDSMRTGAELGGAWRGHFPPKILPGPPSGPPKNFQVSFWKSYTDHWQLPLLQNWPLQWPPQMKMSGSAPARDCAFTRTLQQASISLGLALWCNTVFFAQFCRPFAKYTALRQLLIGV